MVGLNCAAFIRRRFVDSRVATAPLVAGVVSPSQEPRSRMSQSRKIGARWCSRYITARSPSISSSRAERTRAPQRLRADGEPAGFRLHLLLRQFDLARADVLERPHLDLLEPDDLLGHQHLALLGEIRRRRAFGETLEDPDALGADRVGEIIDGDAL